MKKILTSTLLVLVLLSLSGCFQKKDTTEVVTTPEEVAVVEVTAEENINETYEYQNKETHFLYKCLQNGLLKKTYLVL